MNPTMMLLLLPLLPLIATLIVSSTTSSNSGSGRSSFFFFTVTEAFCFSHPPAFRTRPDSTTRHFTTETIAITTKLPLAFFLPDEDRQIRRSPDEEEEEEATNSNVVEKIDKISEVPARQATSKDKATTPRSSQKKRKDNKSMAFLRKIGRVGGAANKNFVNAIGSDEGSTGRQPPASANYNAKRMKMMDGATNTTTGVSSSVRKSKWAYQECTVSGVIDDLSEAFPMASSGVEWRGVTDRVSGGLSDGMLKRETDLHGRSANILMGRVSSPLVPNKNHNNNGQGFLQMVVDLPLDASQNAVDASDYDGIEFDILYRNVDSSSSSNENSIDGDNKVEKKLSPGTFHMHVRSPGTLQQASYRHTFTLEQEDTWETFRVPFSAFKAHDNNRDNSNNDNRMSPRTLDPVALKRIGIVAIGQEMDVFLAMGGLRFYSVF